MNTVVVDINDDDDDGDVCLCLCVSLYDINAYACVFANTMRLDLCAQMAFAALRCCNAVGRKSIYMRPATKSRRQNTDDR